MDAKALKRIVGRIKFRDWEFFIGPLGDGHYLQARFDTLDTRSLEPVRVHGRKWYISPHAIEDEVVKTAWLAVEMALRHEAMEAFTYMGYAPFHPHTSTDALVDLQAAPDAHVWRVHQMAEG